MRPALAIVLVAVLGGCFAKDAADPAEGDPGVAEATGADGTPAAATSTVGNNATALRQFNGTSAAGDWYAMALETGPDGAWAIFDWISPPGTGPLYFLGEAAVAQGVGLQAWGILPIKDRTVWRPVVEARMALLDGTSVAEARTAPANATFTVRDGVIQIGPYKGNEPFRMLAWAVTDAPGTVDLAFRVRPQGNATPAAAPFTDGDAYRLVAAERGTGARLGLLRPGGCDDFYSPCPGPWRATPGITVDSVELAGPGAPVRRTTIRLESQGRISDSWLAVPQLEGNWTLHATLQDLQLDSQGVLLRGAGFTAGFDPAYQAWQMGGGKTQVSLSLTGPTMVVPPVVYLYQLGLDLPEALASTTDESATFSGLNPPA